MGISGIKIAVNWSIGLLRRSNWVDLLMKAKLFIIEMETKEITVPRIFGFVQEASIIGFIKESPAEAVPGENGDILMVGKIKQQTTLLFYFFVDYCIENLNPIVLDIKRWYETLAVLKA